MIIGYLRTSTKAQKPDRQIRGLKGLCDRLYLETFSASTVKSRPVFNQVMNELRAGDTFYVWDLDRAFRNTEDAIHHAKLLLEKGIQFKAANFPIDITTADSFFAYASNAAAAERERMKISERTIEGLQAARQRGVRLGRKPKMTDEEVKAAIRVLASGEATIAELAERHSVHPWTVTRSIRRLGRSLVRTR